MMAAFATFAAAEIRAYAKVLDHTWNNAFAAYQAADPAVICVRVQRYMHSDTVANQQEGGWVEITDDTLV
jgi:hypothetical protein